MDSSEDTVITCAFGVTEVLDDPLVMLFYGSPEHNHDPLALGNGTDSDQDKLTSLNPIALDLQTTSAGLDVSQDLDPQSNPQDGASRELTRKQRGRIRYRNSAPYKGKRTEKRHDTSSTKLVASIKENSLRIVSNINMESLPRSSNYFSGSRSNATTLEIDHLQRNPEALRNEVRKFRVIPYLANRRSILDVRDRNGYRVALRSFRDRRMDAAYMVRLVRRVDDLVTACRVAEPEKPHLRGKFAQLLIGHSHGMGNGNNFPYRIDFHAKHMDAVERFTGSEEVKLMIQVASELLERYFPGVAELFGKTDEFWRSKTEGRIKMEFGYYYTMAINVPMQNPVKTTVHRDVMNFASGPCAIMPYGFFPSHLRVWLVCYTLGIVLQIPSAVWTWILSALITHFNLDTHEFLSNGHVVELVTTSDWEWPTEENTTPLNSITHQRGSIVLYNQASTFHWPITDCRMMDDALKKWDGAQNLAHHMAREARKTLTVPGEA